MPSYKRTLSLPVYGLFDSDGGLVATVRAASAEQARTKFKTLPERARRGGARRQAAEHLTPVRRLGQVDAIRRIWRNAKQPFDRLWSWASGKHPGRWQRLVHWTKAKRQQAREDHRINRAKFWAKKQTIYRRKWKRARKHLAQTGRAVWEDWMANGHPLNFSQAAKDEAAIAIVKYGCAVSSTWRAIVIPLSNPNSFHGPNVNPGKAVDLVGARMTEYQRDVYNRRKGDPTLLEMFGPTNILWLKYGQATSGAEGTFLENLHDTHVHVAADD